MKRGETLTKIAKRYGVSVSSIRKHNKVGKRVKQGKKLKIVTVQRRYKPAPKPVPEPKKETAAPAETPASTPEAAPADTTATPAQEVAAGFTAKPEQTEISENSENAQASETKPQSKPKAKPKRKQPAYTTHTVRRGENLGKSAKRYGVTVKAIQRANNMGGTLIQAGQKLKIPRK